MGRELNEMGDAVEGSLEARQYLTFMLDQECYALGIEQIKEILRNVQLASVPLMPPFVRGVINLRGAVVPVIDLAQLFERPQLVQRKGTSVIVLELDDNGEALEIGVMVDAVCAVVEIGAEAIEPAPSFGTPVRAEFVAGIAKHEGRFVIVLDAARTFALSQMAPVEAGVV